MGKQIKYMTAEEIWEELGEYSDRQIVAEISDFLPKKELVKLLIKMREQW